MLKIKAQSGTGCSRRDFLRVGALGVAGGLTQADVFRGQAQAGARSSHKAVIMIYLAGGPSHIDMYDMKPNAPVEIRGEFKPIATNVPGMQICELMPQQAKIADKFSLVRGVKMVDRHSPVELLSGFTDNIRGDWPDFGCFVTRLRGPGALPAYVNYISGSGNGYPGYLGPAYRAFSGGELQNLRVPDIKLGRLTDRQALLRSFDKMRRDIDRNGEMAGMDAFQAQALELISSRRARDAFDISQEPAAVRNKYGPFQNFLLARRLVEAGVSVVTVEHVPSRDVYPKKSVIPIAYTWDTHEHNFPVLRGHLPAFDSGVATLVSDIYQRGLDQDVAVLVWGEMGRSPRIAAQVVKEGRLNGRDHWGEGGFAFIAGGGLRMGQVIKDTGRYGERCTSRPYTPQNVLATLYHVLGINPEKTLPNPRGGQPRRLLEDTQKIEELV